MSLSLRPRLRCPITILALDIDLSTALKDIPTCKIFIDSTEILAFTGLKLPDEALHATHGIRSCHRTTVHLKLYRGKEVYGEAKRTLWELLGTDDVVTMSFIRSHPSTKKSNIVGTVRLCFRCYENHVYALYPMHEQPADCPTLSHLAAILNRLAELREVNPTSRTLARYYLASLHLFLKKDYERQRCLLGPKGLPVTVNNPRDNLLEDTLVQSLEQLEHFAQSLECYREDKELQDRLHTIGQLIVEQIAYASALFCQYAHMYFMATYDTVGYRFANDSATLIQIQYKLLCLRAQIVYLTRGGGDVSQPKVIKDLIEELLTFALPEIRDTSISDWRKTSYTAVLLCFRWDHAEQVYQSIIERIENTRQDESVLRDGLRRLLTHMVQELDLQPRSLLVKTSSKGAKTLGRGGSGIVSVHQMAFPPDFVKRGVAVKTITCLNTGTSEERRKKRKQLYLEIVHCWTLRHRNILPLLGIEVVGNTSSIVLPLKQNGNMTALMSSLRDGTSSIAYRQPLVTLSHKWIGDVVKGLAYLHTESIVHGDLRGPNVLVDDDLSALIADFGLSIFAEGNSRNYASDRGGNVLWLPPEFQISSPGTSSRPTREGDIYSFAMVCIEAYTASVPFAKEVASGNVFGQRIVDGLRPPRPNEPSREDEVEGHPMNVDLWTLIQRCWHGEKTSRPSITEIEKSLKEMQCIS